MAMVRASPSASLKTPDRDTSRVSPDDSRRSLRAEATVGTAFTVMVKASDTVPPRPSLVVTVMVAVPRPWVTPARVSLEPSDATETVALPVSEDAAVMARLSPSASLNTPDRDTSCVFPVVSPDTSQMAEATVGAAFTVTVNASDTVPPLPSLAVTVMVATPLLGPRPSGRSSRRRRTPWP